MTTETDTVQGTAYDRLLDLNRERALLESSSGILGWDSETMMPTGGLEYRSRQLAQLARLTHGQCS